jgi:hypothetical protein
VSRLDDLRELREALRPQVLEAHSEHGLQGVSGLVGQYRACLAEIEALEAAQPAEKGTVLDELNQRRALKKPAAGQARPAKRQQRRG